MINEPNVEKLLKKCTNRYELVIAISKRARQITSGQTPKVETKEKSEITISSLEFENNKYIINIIPK